MMKQIIPLLLACCIFHVSAQTLQRNDSRNKHKVIPQQKKMNRQQTDSSAKTMPVIKPDTTRTEKMPVAKPPANIQHK